MSVLDSLQAFGGEVLIPSLAVMVVLVNGWVLAADASTWPQWIHVVLVAFNAAYLGSWFSSGDVGG